MKNNLVGLVLKKGREKPVQNRHPWVFSGAIAQISGVNPGPGDLVDIISSDGDWLARGYYNPMSQIRARILSWDTEQSIDEAFWTSKLEKALLFRKKLDLEPETTAYRLVNAEADGIPGLILDKYGDFLVFQALTAGIDTRKDLLVSLFAELVKPTGIIERSDVAVRKKEGLPRVSGVSWGQSPPAEVKILENGLSFRADLYTGHKTGLYLDQRDNRLAICSETHVMDREMLNVFAYTGGFALYAANNGARTIVNIDASDDALQQAQQNIQNNGWDRPQDEYISGDAFQELRKLRDAGRRFELIILDPPKFAFSKSDIPAASRGYKDINMLAIELLNPDGWLATFSCSGLIDIDLFQKIVFGAAVDAGRQVQITKYLGQAADHPVLLTFPESHYLKGFFCRVL